jgi:hypothetical protein
MDPRTLSECCTFAREYRGLRGLADRNIIVSSQERSGTAGSDADSR